MEIRSEWVNLGVSDGTKMEAWVARPASGGAHPGLLIFQEAFGVNAHIRDVTERFAREGYVAIAPEMYHRTAPAYFEWPYDDLAGVMPHINALKRPEAEADQKAAYEWLRSNVDGQKRTGAIGFCMGGAFAFSAALHLPLAGAVSFYGGSIAPNPRGPGMLDRAGTLHAPVLLFWGALDKHIPLENVRGVADALRAAGKEYVNVEISDADHGFFCDARPSYNARAAALSWALTLAFLSANLS